jgi:hypothetical protein
MLGLMIMLQRMPGREVLLASVMAFIELLPMLVYLLKAR